MIARLANYYRVWRRRGAARMDHGLWLHWAIFGRYPAQVDTRRMAETGTGSVRSAGSAVGGSDADAPVTKDRTQEDAPQ